MERISDIHTVIHLNDFTGIENHSVERDTLQAKRMTSVLRWREVS